MKQIAQQAGLQWSGDASVAHLKEIVTVAPRRGTDFMDITVKHAPRDEAVRIANAIAETGSRRARESRELSAAKALEALDEELIAQEELVETHRTDLVTLQKTFDFEFPPEGQPFPDSIGSSLRQTTYKKAVDDHTQASVMLREMKIKQKEARILLKMPHEPITIHQRAE